MTKLAKSGKKIPKTSDLPRIVAKYPGIPYPVHRGKYRASQVAKVTTSGDSAKHRYNLDARKRQKSAKSDKKRLSAIHFKVNFIMKWME